MAGQPGGMKKRRLLVPGLVLGLVLLLVALWWGRGGLDLPGADGQPDGRSAAEILAGREDTALAEALLALPTPAELAAPYDRDQFGARWADVDRNGCDTRNDILARDLTEVRWREGTHQCVVERGTLADPYTGQQIRFQRGEKTSPAVQIDHVVALANAWESGADRWSDEQREQFANDPLNLLAVDGPANQQKGAASADRWLPPNPFFHCEYAARQVAVKQKWDLAVTEAERSALARILVSCEAPAAKGLD